jgi:hypothetical protein
MLLGFSHAPGPFFSRMLHQQQEMKSSPEYASALVRKQLSYRHTVVCRSIASVLYKM